MSRLEDYIYINDGYAYFLHSIKSYNDTLEVLESILENGLYIGSGELHFTITSIGTCKTEGFDNLISTIENYSYDGGSKTIIMRMPFSLLLTDYSKTLMRYTGDIQLNMLCDYEPWEEYDYAVLPSKFILGYYDSISKDFVLNDKYHFVLTQDDISTIANNIVTFSSHHASIVKNYPTFNKEEVERNLKIALMNDSNKKAYRRRIVIDNIIKYYDQQETEEMKLDYSYNNENDILFIISSVKNKKINISDYAISEIYMNGKIDMGNGLEWSVPAIIRLAQLLKSAKKLSEINHYDYLGELVSLQPIHTIIGEILKSPHTYNEFRDTHGDSTNKVL